MMDARNKGYLWNVGNFLADGRQLVAVRLTWAEAKTTAVETGGAVVMGSGTGDRCYAVVVVH